MTGSMVAALSTDHVQDACVAQRPSPSYHRHACLQGTAFPESERERLELRGLLPKRQLDMAAQARRPLLWVARPCLRRLCSSWGTSTCDPMAQSGMHN